MSEKPAEKSLTAVGLRLRAALARRGDSPSVSEESSIKQSLESPSASSSINPNHFETPTKQAASAPFDPVLSQLRLLTDLVQTLKREKSRDSHEDVEEERFSRFRKQIDADFRESLNELKEAVTHDSDSASDDDDDDDDDVSKYEPPLVKHRNAKDSPRLRFFLFCLSIGLVVLIAPILCLVELLRL
jgi:hypothetical protein